jgi:hypothetical protein
MTEQLAPHPPVNSTVTYHYGNTPCPATVTSHNADGTLGLTVRPPEGTIIWPPTGERTGAGYSFDTSASAGGPDGRTPTPACWTHTDTLTAEQARVQVSAALMESTLEEATDKEVRGAASLYESYLVATRGICPFSGVRLPEWKDCDTRAKGAFVVMMKSAPVLVAPATPCA